MKVEVNVLGSPSLNSPYGLCGRKAILENANVITSEVRSCVKVEADVLGSTSLKSPYGFCGRKATLKGRTISRAEQSCANKEVVK